MCATAPDRSSPMFISRTSRAADRRRSCSAKTKRVGSQPTSPSCRSCCRANKRPSLRPIPKSCREVQGSPASINYAQKIEPVSIPPASSKPDHRAVRSKCRQCAASISPVDGLRSLMSVARKPQNSFTFSLKKKGHRAGAKLLTKDEARLIAADIASCRAFGQSLMAVLFGDRMTDAVLVGRKNLQQVSVRGG